ncbi:MAG: hypothetical protein HKN50_04680 [Gammaproteobacteria bacterium]|nr:hypothetical protein [Gammaproteobacteria bacterium]
MSTDHHETIQSGQAALAQGEYLAAYEYALAGIEHFPDDDQLKHLAVLALARMGATRQASKLYQEYQLAEINEVDPLALGARLKKDMALMQSQQDQAPYFEDAARAYERIFVDFGRNDYYPAINAASLYMLANEPDLARELAAETVALCEQQEANYWSLASLAEARLLLGEIDACKQALQQACAGEYADIASKAATRKQFKMLGAPDQVLAELTLPGIIHFAGHIIGAPGAQSRYPAEQESEVADQINAFLEQHNVMIGYGSLAAGADIQFAEALLERGGEVNIVLPFDRDDFIEASVLSAGGDWLDRFEQVMQRASKVTYSATGTYEGNSVLFHNCSLYAMGLACLRRSHLGAPVKQVVVWDGEQTNMAAGTAGDRATWQRLGHESHVIAVQSNRSKQAAPTAPAPTVTNSDLTAVVFGDVAGFSKLSDREIPIFVEYVMGTLARAIDKALGGDKSHLRSVNTWGDGIFMVFDDADVAAACANHMLVALQNCDLTDKGIEEQPQLRLGANYGPVFQFTDPITGRLNFFGHQVNTAARIEPIAPQGEVYLTESFAAQLALHPAQRFAADYVGEMQLAKNFGKSRMYLLKPQST